MRRKLCAWTAALVAAVAGTSVAQEHTLPVLEGAQVSAFVDEASPGLLRYHYRITHTGSALKIRGVILDIGADAGRETCPSITPPRSWTGSLIPRASVVLGWLAIVDDSMLAPGGSQTFAAICGGLPGTRTLRLEPDLLSEEIHVEEEEYATVEDSDQLLRTVGPVPLPADFEPREFVRRILQLRDEAATAGWIRDASATATLTELLSRLDDELAAERFEAARATAEQTAQEVERISCSEFACDAARPLTAEARALLALNLRYLATQLPPPSK